MIRWREDRNRSFRVIAGLLVALLVAGFVRVALGLVLTVAASNALAGIAFTLAIAVLVFRAAGRRRDDSD